MNRVYTVEIEASGDYFHNFFEFFQTFTSVLKLESNSEKTFSLSARKHCEKKNGKVTRLLPLSKCKFPLHASSFRKQVVYVLCCYRVIQGNISRRSFSSCLGKLQLDHVIEKIGKQVPLRGFADDV